MLLHTSHNELQKHDFYNNLALHKMYQLLCKNLNQITFTNKFYATAMKYLDLSKCSPNDWDCKVIDKQIQVIVVTYKVNLDRKYSWVFPQYK